MNIKDKISKVKCFLLDLDGTVYLDGDLIGDMKNTLNKIRKSGRKIVYLTNNSSKSLDDYIVRLKNIGIWEEGDVMYSSAVAAYEYINTYHKGKSVYVLGTESLKRELKAQGVNVVEDSADIMLLGYDTELTYDKLCKACLSLRNGALYVATHPDVNCPGKVIPLPDAGSFMKLIESSVGRLPDVICGKPEKNMGDLIMGRFGLKGEEIIMVGDRLYTDIKFGINSGFNTLLVLSGETSIKDYEESGLKVTLVLDTLNDVLKYL